MKKTNPLEDLQFWAIDGRDGPTNANGGILNENSLNLIKEKVNLQNELLNNNSYQVLKK